MRTVVILAVDGVIAFDLATAIEVFRWTVDLGGRPGYEVLVAGPEREIGAGPIGMLVPHGLDALDRADLVIVPGRDDPTSDVPAAVLESIRRAHARGAVVASICAGAFDVAAAGLLTARRATTHWAAADRLAAMYPEITVDARALYVDEGDVLTSAGAAAGLDLCLHLVERDYGAAVAAETARRSVVPLRRSGTQAQFIERDIGRSSSSSLAPTLQWIEQHAHERLTVGAIAEHAHLSVRTLTRRFRTELDTSPGEYLATVRVRRALSLLETTHESVTEIAATAGFGTATNLRARFRTDLETAPTRYRSTFAGTPRR